LPANNSWRSSILSVIALVFSNASQSQVVGSHKCKITIPEKPSICWAFLLCFHANSQKRWAPPTESRTNHQKTCLILYIVYTIYTMFENLSDKDKKAFILIRSRIIHSGESPALREINEVTGGKSPRSASLVVERLIDAGLVTKSGRKLKLTDFGMPSETSVSTVRIPLVGSVACGAPMLAEENVETYIPVSTALAKKGSNYFLLRAAGDSMDKADIYDRDILLVRQQDTAKNGDKVVALIDDEATVKVFEKTANAVILRPKSTNSKYTPIILTNNCKIQGVVIAVLPSDLY
jgi:repressor LexA